MNTRLQRPWMWTALSKLQVCPALFRRAQVCYAAAGKQACHCLISIWAILVLTSQADGFSSVLPCSQLRRSPSMAIYATSYSSSA